MLVFLAGTFCGIATIWRSHAEPTAAPPPPARPIHVAPAAAPPLRLDATTPTVEPPLLSRNIFAFVEPPPAPAPVILQTRSIAAPVAAPQPVIAEPPAPPPFPYRYIGTFGPRDRALAAFARDGDVINVRVGEPIGAGFTLQRIGLESVDVSWGGPGDLRVPLTR